MKASVKTSEVAKTGDADLNVKPLYLESLTLVERLHRRLLDVIKDEDLCNRAEQLGGRLKQRLASIAEKAPEIVDIRGPGFMNAV